MFDFTAVPTPPSPSTTTTSTGYPDTCTDCSHSSNDVGIDLIGAILVLIIFAAIVGGRSKGDDEEYRIRIWKRRR